MRNIFKRSFTLDEEQLNYLAQRIAHYLQAPEPIKPPLLSALIRDELVINGEVHRRELKKKLFCVLDYLAGHPEANQLSLRKLAAEIGVSKDTVATALGLWAAMKEAEE